MSTCILKFSPQLYTENLLNEHPVSAAQETWANLIQNPQLHSPLYDICEALIILLELSTNISCICMYRLCWASTWTLKQHNVLS